MPNPVRESDPAAPKTIVVRRANPDALNQAELVTWPHSFRPKGYYEGQAPIPVPAY